MSTANARVILARAQTFGGGAELSAHVVALIILLDSPKAREELEGVAIAGTPAGRLWALCGLQAIDPSGFQALRAQLENSEDRVDTIFGDTGMSQSVSDVAKFIARGNMATQIHAARDRMFHYVNALANQRLNATGVPVTGVAGATPAPVPPAR